MWNKFIAWLLAVVTALLNSFGVYVLPDKEYRREATYTIQNDAVDYGELYRWHNNTYNGTNSCRVDNIKHEPVSLGKNNIAFPVAGVRFNPDAKIELSDEAVILAPEDCEVVTSPNKENKIIIQNNLSGNLGFKMEIKNPKRWFCCVDAKPDASGNYRHQQVSHKIKLKQGDVVAIASSDTKLTFYRGEGTTGGPKKCDLAEFLRRIDESGNELENMSGDVEQVVTQTEYLRDAINQEIKIPADKVYTGPSGWRKDGDRWWWGRSGVAKKDYPADQYIVYEGYYYYFDKQGWMVTGWGPDSYYYSESLADRGFKEGALCYETIVPDGIQKYAYVDSAGYKNNKAGKHTMVVGTTSYIYDFNADFYIKTSDTTGSSSANNGGGQSIIKQEGRLTKEQWNTLMRGQPISTAYSGWWQYESQWVYLDAGDFRYSDFIRGWKSNNGDAAYILELDGQSYFFRESDNVLLQGNSLNDTPVYASYTNARDTKWVVLNEDKGVFKNTWIRADSGEWMYALSNGILARKTFASDGNRYGDFVIPENSHNHYVFNTNSTLDVTTESITVSGVTSGDYCLQLNPDKPDGPRLLVPVNP